MKDYSLLKINLMGGIVSPGTLQYILSAAREAGVREVRFGARQQILMYVKSDTVRGDRKSTRLNSSHSTLSRMPSSA